MKFLGNSRAMAMQAESRNPGYKVYWIRIKRESMLVCRLQIDPTKTMQLLYWKRPINPKITVHFHTSVNIWNFALDFLHEVHMSCAWRDDVLAAMLGMFCYQVAVANEKWTQCRRAPHGQLSIPRHLSGSMCCAQTCASHVWIDQINFARSAASSWNERSINQFNLQKKLAAYATKK